MSNPAKFLSGLVSAVLLHSLCIPSVAFAAQETTSQAVSAPAREYGPKNHDVAIPKVIYAPDPEFSDKARRKKLSGTCVVSVLVDAQGNSQEVQLIKSLGEGLSPKQHSAAASLDQNALAAVRQYHFQPATLQGKPVPYRLKIEVDFRVY